MQFRKIIISFLLLLTYSFGFTHNLVPHCGEFSIVTNNGLSHQHAKKQEQNPNHNHITHNSHLDEGVYNYIICLVNEIENSETECSVEHCFTFNPNNLSLKKINQLPNTIILFVALQPTINKEKISRFSSHVETRYLSPLLEESPNRGPPFIS